MITLRQLEFALAVAKHRHFKRAAQECKVSQSALSLGIGELEKQLDAQIFERNNKQVLITPLGDNILSRARRIFSEINDLTALAHSTHKPLTHPMHIGIIPTVAPYLLPKALVKLSAAYPNFSFSISENQTEQLIDAVRFGHIDTAIIALPYPIDALHSFEFWEEDFYAIFPSQDPLGKKDSINADALTKTNLMLLGEGHCLTSQALSICALNKEQMRSAFSEASLNTLIQMAVAGMGTTLIPQMALSSLSPQQDQLNAVRLEEPSPHRRIAFITRLNYARVDDIRLLCDIFHDALLEAHAN